MNRRMRPRRIAWARGEPGLHAANIRVNAPIATVVSLTSYHGPAEKGMP